MAYPPRDLGMHVLDTRPLPGDLAKPTVMTAPMAWEWGLTLRELGSLAFSILALRTFKPPSGSPYQTVNNS